MKQNLKRIFCLLLALAMVLSFAACGDSNKPVDTDDDGWDIDHSTSGNLGDINNIQTPDNKDQIVAPQVKDADSLSWRQLVAQMPKELKGTTVYVYSWNPIKDVTGAQKVIDNFTKDTGIKVKWVEGNYEQYATNIAAFINAGESPDIIRYNAPNPATMYLCQDMQKATGYDFSGDIWDKETIKALTVKGKIYGANLKNTFNNQPTVVFYNAATVKNNDMDDPYTLWKKGEWTFDKFKELCLEFKELNNRAAWMTSTPLDLLWVKNLSPIKFDGQKYTNNINDPKILTTLQEACNYHDNSIMAGAQREFDLIENGTVLFFTSNILAARRTDFHFTTIKAENNLRTVPFPQIEGQEYYQNMQESEGYGIPKGAKNPGAVYYFLRYYLNADNYDEDMFFCNAQALETYQWCISQKNKVFGTTGELTKSIGSEYAGLPDFVRKGGTAAQCKNQIDSVANVFQRAVDEGNKLIAKF